jgi:hypothetical protein
VSGLHAQPTGHGHGIDVSTDGESLGRTSAIASGDAWTQTLRVASHVHWLSQGQG